MPYDIGSSMEAPHGKSSVYGFTKLLKLSNLLHNLMILCLLQATYVQAIRLQVQNYRDCLLIFILIENSYEIVYVLQI